MIPVGVLLTPIIKKQVLSLDDSKGKSFTVDAFNIMYQFLALIRTREGTPLTDKEGRTTSHLVGLAFRTTRLISDYNTKLVFVFDGKPPLLKQDENKKRRKAKQKAQKEYKEAVAKRDYATAFSKATRMSSLTRDEVQDAKQLLDLLGIPWVQAPSEGEAQAAYIVSKGEVWASNSRDYDSLLFGTPRLVRYLTIGGQEWLPSKNRARKLEPELITLNDFLEHLEVTRPQLIDMAILIGTDFNEGIKGIGPKTALKLIRKHEKLENLPPETFEKLPNTIQEIREFFLNPPVTDDYDVATGELDEDGLISFLCEERSFSRDRVNTVLKRIKNSASQRSLKDFFGGN